MIDDYRTHFDVPFSACLISTDKVHVTGDRTIGHFREHIFEDLWIDKKECTW